MTMTACDDGGGGGGIIPASRFLRRRAAAHDLGGDAAADADSFWAAAPRLYDFSQQQQQQQPARRSPSPEPEPSSPCLLVRRKKKRHERSPSPSPSPRSRASGGRSGTATCLLAALHRTCVGWGATRRAEYFPGRLRLVPASPAASSGPGTRMAAPAAGGVSGDGGEGEEEEEEEMSSSGAAVKRSNCLGLLGEVAKNEQQQEEEEVPAAVVGVGQESGSEEEDKPRVRRSMKKARWNSRKEEEEEEEEDKPRARRGRRKARWSGLRRRRGAPRRAKKAPRVVKEEEEHEEVADVKPAAVAVKAEEEEEPRLVVVGKKRAAKPTSARAAKRARKTAPKQEEDDDEKKTDAAVASPPASPAVAAEAEPTESKPSAALVPVPVPGGGGGGKVERWSAWRYAAGEATLLDILRSRGATAGSPAPRVDLRAEARRSIGDTGLLDHLLRHVADKVPAGSDDRVRRRYNPAGGLEYWIEPAGLAEVRREAGVMDPYWVPPPGWKVGDPVSAEARTVLVQKQVEELTGELDVVKSRMKQLDSNLVQVSKEAYLSWKGYDCMVKANGKLEKEVLSLEEKCENAAQVNGELKELLLLLKDKYDTVVEKNEKLEGQMLALSTSFQSMKEELLLQRIEQQPLLMLAQEPWEEGDKQQDDAGAHNKALVCAGNQLADADAAAVDGSFGSNNHSGSAACGDEMMPLRMRACMREGACQWPRSAAASGGSAGSHGDELPQPLTPGADLVVADFDTVISSLAPPSMEEYLLAADAAAGLPTPTSASSSSNESPKLQLLPPSPASPPIQVLPLPSTAMVIGEDLNLQLRHMDTSSSSSSGPFGASKALKLDTGAGGGGEVGTELVLATPTY